VTSAPHPESAPEEIRYCLKCGSELITKKVGDKPRRTCSNCNYIHFTDPKVGVGILVISEGKVLLVKRGFNPELGKWSIPAGFLDYGEDPQKAAVREVLEETNLEVKIFGLLDVYYNQEALTQGGASIFILYHAELRQGEIRAGDDAEEAAFFELSALPELAFSSTKEAIFKWRNAGDYKTRPRTAEE